MDVVFEVYGRTHTVPERQATILAENLRLLAKSESADVELYALRTSTPDWREEASALADAIESALVARVSKPLPLEGPAAEATSRVLRLMVGMEASIDPSGATGLRDALGTPVSKARVIATPSEAAAPSDEPPKHLARRELVELLVILFAIAVLTVVAVAEGIVAWYAIGSVIAALLGLRVATTRVKGKFAWSVATVMWWAILLIPAMIFVLLLGLLFLAVLR